jgi:hypothetical protein
VRAAIESAAITVTETVRVLFIRQFSPARSAVASAGGRGCISPTNDIGDALTGFFYFCAPIFAAPGAA